MGLKLLCLTPPYYSSEEKLDDDRFTRLSNLPIVDEVHHIFRGEVDPKNTIATAHHYCLGPYQSKLSISNSYITKLPKHISRYDIDLVYCFSYRLLPLVTISLFGSDCSLIFDCGVSWKKSFDSPFDRLIWIPAIKASLIKVDYVVCLADHLKSEVAELGVSDATRVYPLNTLDKFIKNKEEYTFPEDRIILFVGRMTPQKNPMSLLEHFDSMECENETGLHFVGDNIDGSNRGETAKKIMRMAECRSNVHWHGWIPYDDLPAYYNAADIVALPSSTEGFPAVLKEALASGTPVVCSKIPAFKEIVTEDFGRLATVHSPEFTAKLEELVSNPDLSQQLGKQGRYFIERNVEKSNHSLNRIVKNAVRNN